MVGVGGGRDGRSRVKGKRVKDENGTRATKHGRSRRHGRHTTEHLMDMYMNTTIVSPPFHILLKYTIMTDSAAHPKTIRRASR